MTRINQKLMISLPDLTSLPLPPRFPTSSSARAPAFILAFTESHTDDKSVVSAASLHTTQCCKILAVLPPLQQILQTVFAVPGPAMDSAAYLWTAAALLLAGSATAVWAPEKPPPLPVMPIPTASQLRWQQREMVMFLHFGMNTFTNSEWGTGAENPIIFEPVGLDAAQWVDVAKTAGFSLMILTAKHHDGFCLWQTRYTDHCVRGSLNWRNGTGDVVRELANAAGARGVDLGVYLSPWDRHEPSYGHQKAYNEFYLAQLHELLTQYGPIAEVWFDGAKGSNAPNMTYMFDKWFSTVHELQIAGNVFSDAGPDVRWVGDENGSAGSTCWSSVNRTLLRIGNATLEPYLNTGDPYGTDWVPAECDVSIRRGWFWHPQQQPKALSKLLHIYYSSVGHNCLLLLNVPPNTTGLLSSDDVARLFQFRAALDRIFGRDVAVHAGVATSASSVRGAPFGPANVLDGADVWRYWAPRADVAGPHWLELRSRRPMRFNVVRLQETIVLGQRVARYEIVAGAGDGVHVANGTTVGYKRLHRLPFHVSATLVRLVIHEWKGDEPLISSFGLHLDPYFPKTHDVACVEE